MRRGSFLANFNQLRFVASETSVQACTSILWHTYLQKLSLDGFCAREGAIAALEVPWMVVDADVVVKKPRSRQHWTITNNTCQNEPVTASSAYAARATMPPTTSVDRNLSTGKEKSDGCGPARGASRASPYAQRAPSEQPPRHHGHQYYHRCRPTAFIAPGAPLNAV